MTEAETEILKVMGFDRLESGRYKHRLLEEKFDFSSCSFEGVIYVVYNKAEQNGISIIQHQIQNIIGLK